MASSYVFYVYSRRVWHYEAQRLGGYPCLMFLIQLLGSTNISVKHPVSISVDNIGTVFMASNNTNTSCIRHMEKRYEYVNEYVEDNYFC